jgi:protein TonB
VNDPVDQLLDEREAIDRGFPGGILLSLLGHLTLLGGAFGVLLLAPREPPLKVMDGFAVPLPPGGLGRPNPEPAAPAAAAPAPEPSAEAPPAPKPEPPPKVIKPPKEEPRKGLPEPDARRAKPRPESTPPPRYAPPGADRGAAAAAGERAGTGNRVETPGFEFGPPGPGVPGGTDMMGDWYLAAVQRKVWTIWMQQVKANFSQPITIQFTILADGSLGEDVRVVQTSGVSLLDLAAQRAIYNAAPFGPLPKHYATNRLTIQGIFKPTP